MSATLVVTAKSAAQAAVAAADPPKPVAHVAQSTAVSVSAKVHPAVDLAIVAPAAAYQVAEEVPSPASTPYSQGSSAPTNSSAVAAAAAVSNPAEGATAPSESSASYSPHSAPAPAQVALAPTTSLVPPVPSRQDHHSDVVAHSQQDFVISQPVEANAP